MDTIKRNPIKFGFALLAIAALSTLGWYLAISWNRPLGEPLSLPTNTPVEVSTVEKATETPDQEEGEKTQEPEVTLSPTVTSTATLTPTPEYVCGGPEYMNILVTGVASESYLYGLADAIRVVRMDFNKQKVTVLSLPRDLWVDVPISVPNKTNGITPAKLNQAYFYGSEGMGFYENESYGSGLMAETLQSNYGLHVDNYLAVNLYSFRSIIDHLGGIDVCLADPVYKKKTDYYSGLEFPVHFLDAGCQHLTGEQAEYVVRQRILIGDAVRIKRQTAVLKAVALKLLSQSGRQALPDLVERMKTYVLLDLTPAEISQLLCLAGKIDRETDITYVDIPEDMLEASWEENVAGQFTSVLIVDQGEMQALMADFQQGLWP